MNLRKIALEVSSINQYMKQHGRIYSLGRMISFGMAYLLLILTVSPGVVAAAISQGYQSDGSIVAGTIVASETSNQKDQVVAANSDNVSNLVGVVVADGNATLAVVSSEDSLQVGTSGVTDVFVSDLGGEVKSGDAITASPISGVGMKANEAVKIVGIAQADAVYGDKRASVSTKDGKQQEVRIGSVPIVIQIVYYVPKDKKSPVPEALQLFVDSLAGKQVPLARLVASVAIVLAAVITISILLYSAIHNTMISIGRNPLAQGSIYRGLWQVVITSFIIFVAALGSAYFVLTR